MTGSDNPRERLREAREAAARGENDIALEGYLWFWRHALDLQPALVGVRGSFFLRDFAQLAEAYPAAARALDGLAADLSAKLKAGLVTEHEVRDLVAIKRVMGAETETTLLLAQATADGVLDSFGTRLWSTFVEHELWESIRRFPPDPRHMDAIVSSADCAEADEPLRSAILRADGERVARLLIAFEATGMEQQLDTAMRALVCADTDLLSASERILRSLDRLALADRVSELRSDQPAG